jgi:hypothetical protein
MKLMPSTFVKVGLFSLLFGTGCASQQVVTNNNTGGQPQTQTVAAERTYLEGRWSYTMTNPDQAPFSGTIWVQRGGPAGYSGWISINSVDYEAPTNITKAELHGENFIYMGQVKTLQGSYNFEMKGTIKGDKMEGQNKVQTEDGPVTFKVVATRQ